VYEGLRVGIPSRVDPTLLEYAEFGAVRWDTVGFRSAGSLTWRQLKQGEAVDLNLKPEHAAVTWPDEDEKLEAEFAKLVPTLSYGQTVASTWKSLAWTNASDAFAERMWAKFGKRFLDAMSRTGWERGSLKVPVVFNHRLEIGLTNTTAALAPTNRGWAEFLQLAPDAGLRWSELDEVAAWWWGRSVPRDILSAANEDGEEA
jgi:hypothetical protein